jgi:hypothetical protein
MNWIELARYWDEGKALVNMVMNSIQFGENS